jgi:uncharacterized membrane protein (UPF0127 family)
MRRRRIVAAALGCALVACGGDDPVSPASSPGSASPSPTGSASATVDGQERSVTGQVVSLPPPPEGGFDAVVTVRVAGAPALRVEVARRPDQRSRGLMQRAMLPDGTGMLFLFPRRSSGGFYMLGTLVPLSIAYVDGDRVVSTTEMTPCPGQSCPTYPPDGPYTMAIEAPAGFFPGHGVKAGARVTVEGTTAPPA